MPVNECQNGCCKALREAWDNPEDAIFDGLVTDGTPININKPLSVELDALPQYARDAGYGSAGSAIGFENSKNINLKLDCGCTVDINVEEIAREFHRSWPHKTNYNYLELPIDFSVEE